MYWKIFVFFWEIMRKWEVKGVFSVIYSSHRSPAALPAHRRSPLSVAAQACSGTQLLRCHAWVGASLAKMLRPCRYNRSRPPSPFFFLPPQLSSFTSMAQFTATNPPPSNSSCSDDQLLLANSTDPLAPPCATGAGHTRYSRSGGSPWPLPTLTMATGTATPSAPTPVHLQSC